MTIRSTVFGGSKLFVLLIAAVAGASGGARASDQAAQNYLQTLTAADITATANTQSPGPMSVMVSHARAARALFGEARAAMERAALLGEISPKANVTAVETAMRDMRLHLAILQSTAKPRTAEVVKKASALAQAWYEAGMTVIKPSEGVVELPSPVSIQNKADAAAAALEQVIQDAVSALTPPPARQARAPKRRATAPGPAAGRKVGDSANLAGVLGLNRDTHY